MPNKLVHVERLVPIDGRYRQCEHVDMWGVPGTLGMFERRRCGRDAAILVIQEGELSGRQFPLALCETHGQSYVDYAEKIQKGER